MSKLTDGVAAYLASRGVIPATEDGKTAMSRGRLMLLAQRGTPDEKRRARELLAAANVEPGDGTTDPLDVIEGEDGTSV